MADPREGVSDTGVITTGIRRDRVPPPFEGVIAAAVAATPPQVSLYLYGSVATGRATVPSSDVDLLSIGLSAAVARSLSADLTERYAQVCRDVTIGPGQADEFAGDDDEAYGNRVFLRHYCVHLTGPDHRDDHDFPPDARAARGFNGDIDRHADRWRSLIGQRHPALLGRSVGRKTLLAVAGLVSVHDRTWTTDRATAAKRWGEISPGVARDLRRLHDWATEGAAATTVEVAAALDGVVAEVVAAFETSIGLWDADDD